MMRLTAYDHTTHQPGSFYPRGCGGGAEDRGMHPTARGAVTHASPEWEWTQNRACVPPRASYQLGVGAFDAHRTTTTTTDSPTPSYTRPSYRETFHPTPALTSSSNGTIWSGPCTNTPDAPPPLDFAKSPYSCIPLPAVSPPLSSAAELPQQRQCTPRLNPILAYSCTLQYSAHTTFHFQPRYYDLGAPATNPKVGSVKILLPGGSAGVTVHAAPERGFVAVGDVLDALDSMFLRNRSLGSLELEGSYDALDRGRCGCFCIFDVFKRSVLDELRTRYAQAGLVWREGADCWELITA